jgi:hypothetical protein
MKEWATEEEVRAQLARHDFKFWYDRTKLAQGRKHIEGVLGKRIRPVDFKRLREDLEWWTVMPRIEPTSETCLDYEGWVAIRAAVNEFAPFLRGRDINEATAIVSIRYRCNASLLNGLNSDMRVWQC